MQLNTIDPEVISSLVLNGDLKRLSPDQKVAYYRYRCEQAGLDPAAKPFDLLVLNGKEILYANATCTQQLTANRGLSIAITNRELIDGVYCVFARIASPDGRATENMGAVPIDMLKGEAKANAMLKATTKAIRRSVLAHCGLGLMDETEVVTIPGAQMASMPEPTTAGGSIAQLPPPPKAKPSPKAENFVDAVADGIEFIDAAGLAELEAAIAAHKIDLAAFVRYAVDAKHMIPTTDGKARMDRMTAKSWAKFKPIFADLTRLNGMLAYLKTNYSAA